MKKNVTSAPATSAAAMMYSAAERSVEIS